MRTADKYTRKRVETSLAKAGIESWEGETISAYLNLGWWVAACPCNGAELVAPDLSMLCGSCGAEHKVVFPRNRRAIETVLEKRDSPNQNWTVETVAELTAENIENGLWEGM